MIQATENELIHKLQDNCYFGRKLVIVIGSGISRGVDAPSMLDIHTFLKQRLERFSDKPAVQNVLALLDTLLASLPGEAAAPDEHPRSVMVRLYDLLQASDDTDIQETWEEFGIKLVCGQLGEPKEPLWRLEPSTWERHSERRQNRHDGRLRGGLGIDVGWRVGVDWSRSARRLTRSRGAEGRSGWRASGMLVA